MPYSKKTDLPPAVKNNLPSHAQEIFRKVFNSAYKEYGGDEKKAFKVAWSAVTKAGYSKGSSGKWKMSK